MLKFRFVLCFKHFFIMLGLENGLKSALFKASAYGVKPAMTNVW